MDCPFCSMYEKNERVILKNDFAWAFPTNIPVVPGHILVSPIRHVGTFEDCTIKEQAAIFDMYGKMKKALEKTFYAEGFNIAWNENRVAGQSVPHFHMHILPRKEGDTGITEYEPRKFLYRPGEREATPEEELASIVYLIQQSL